MASPGGGDTSRCIAVQSAFRTILRYYHLRHLGVVPPLSLQSMPFNWAGNLMPVGRNLYCWEVSFVTPDGAAPSWWCWTLTFRSPKSSYYLSLSIKHLSKKRRSDGFNSLSQGTGQGLCGARIHRYRPAPNHGRGAAF